MTDQGKPCRIFEAKIGVCFDTCHVWDAGYDIVNDLDGVLAEFDRVIGLGYLRAIHINDSKNDCGARKDRHEKLGQGKIGAEALERVVRHPLLQGKPFILETPNEDEGLGRKSRPSVNGCCAINRPALFVW